MLGYIHGVHVVTTLHYMSLPQGCQLCIYTNPFNTAFLTRYGIPITILKYSDNTVVTVLVAVRRAPYFLLSVATLR